MDSGTLVLIGAALGSGGILTVLGKELIAWARGRTKEEADAWKERDKEAKKRRIVEEYAHLLRGHLIRVGEEPDSWPPYDV